MNIAFFITEITNSGGMERVSIYIANKLAEKKGINVFFISRIKGKPFYSLSDNIKYLYLAEEQENHYLHFLKYIYKLNKLWRRYKIDKWIDVGSNMSLLSIPTLLLYRKVDVFTWEHFNLTWTWNPITANLSRRLASSFSKKMIVLTQTDRVRFEEKFKSNKIVCIPNPITINPPETEYKGTDKIIISIGRYDYQKGYDILIDIWKETKARHDEWKLKIVGGGELRDNLLEQCKNAGVIDSVELLSPIKDVVSLYKTAAFFVMSSRFEGLPLVLIEATSMGLPIISFDCETGPRDVVTDGYNGFLIDCYNKKDFSDKIDVLCSNEKLRKAYSVNAKERSKSFSESNIMSQWYKILEIE